MDITTFQHLFESYGISLLVLAGTAIGSLVLSPLLALGRLSRPRPISLAFRLVISLLRDMPLILQLLVAVLLVSLQAGFPPEGTITLAATMAVFILNYAARLADLCREGVQSVPRQQWDEAEVLGYTKRQATIRIILPQAFAHVRLALTGELASLVRDTAFVCVIGFVELLSNKPSLEAAQHGMAPLVIAALLYWLTCVAVRYALRQIGKGLSRNHA